MEPGPQCRASPAPIRSSFICPVIIDPEYHYESVNVENQERNLSSLLWWTRRVISMRKRFRAFSRGTVQFLPVDNGKVIAHVRQFEDEKVLVVANLSRFAQVAELDLGAFAGLTPGGGFQPESFPGHQAADALCVDHGPVRYLLAGAAAGGQRGGGGPGVRRARC